MPLTVDTSPSLHPCAECRMTFETPRALRRHVRLDHTADPAGAALAAELLARSPAAPPALPASPAGTAGADQSAPPDPGVPSGPPGTRGRRTLLLSLALVVVLALAVAGGLLGTLLELALWAVVLTALVVAALGLLGAGAVRRSPRSAP